MLGRTTWDKLPVRIFENFEIVQVKRGQFQIFKNHECDLSQMSPRRNMITGQSHQTSKKFALKLSLNSGQLQISGQLQNNTFNGAMSI